MMMRKSMMVVALFCGVVLADEPLAPPAMQPVPDAGPDAAAAPNESVEPQVTIIQREKETVEEYRIHNQLYMIKVTPKKGKPYYMVDSDGDGKLDSRRNELDPKILIPSWVIFKW